MINGIINSILWRTSGGASNSGYGSGIEITLTDLAMDKQAIMRDGSTNNFTINVPTNYFCTWAIRETTTETIVQLGSGLNASFNAVYNMEDESGFGALPTFVKEYDVVVTASKNGVTYKRTFTSLIKVLPAIFTEGEADVVWNLSSSTSYKDGAYTDRPGYKIFIKGTHTGSGYIAFEQWRSSDPKNPIVMQFDNTAKVTINTSNAYLIQANFDCQNLIIDGCANASEEYGFTGTFTGTGSQGVRIQPVDSGISTLSPFTAGYNICICGIEIDGNRSGGSGFNVNFDSVTGATIQYDTYTFTGFKMSNCRAFDTTDEGVYIGRFNDQLVSGYAKPSITGMSFCYNIVDTSGGDGMQFGIVFDSDIHNNLGINLNWRNATDHRNLLQLVGCRNTNVFQNRFYNNTGEGGSSLWNISTGRGGSNLQIFSNLFVNLYTGSHANAMTFISQNSYDNTIENFNIYNNTFIIYTENSLEVWRDNTGVTTVLNPFRIVDNAILNLNDSTEVHYQNSPDQSGYTVSNLFNQSSSYFGFANYGSGDYKPIDLDAALWGARTSFTKLHRCGNNDLEGYEYKDGIRGCYSGVPLIIQGSDITTTTTSTSTTTSTTTTTTTSAPLPPTNVKVNFFTGTASGWIATGATSPKPGTDSPVDFGQLGSTGVGLRSLNVDTTHRWNATGSGGPTTGANTGVYPDAVLQTYWYMDGVNIAGFELYDHTGTPLTGRTFTITLLGARTVGSARYMKARVNGGAWSPADPGLDVNNNTANVITFTGVTVSGGKILIEIDSMNDSFAYINGMTLDSE